MKKSAKIVSVILIILTVAVVGFAVGTGAVGYVQKKQAIIIIPGFLGSYLMDADNGEIYWDPLYTTSVNGMNPFKRFDGILQDEEGKSINNIRAATMQDKAMFGEEEKSLYGGVMNTYTDTYKRTYERYHNDYDVVVWQYDWRVDNHEAAKALDKYISSKHWEKVILLPHSMGGIVASTYLAMGEEQRSKVSLYCSFATPYYGVVDIVNLFEAGEFPFVNEQVTTLIGKTGLLKKLAVNMTALFQMLPGEELLNTDYYKNGETDGLRSFIYKETSKGVFEPVTSWSEILELYSSRPWAKYVDSGDKNGSLKAIFSDNLNYNKTNLYVTGKDGKKVHVTNMVKSFYVGGTNGTDSTSGAICYNLDGTTTRLGATMADGTVVTASTLMGKKADNKQFFFFPGYAHTNTMTTDTAENPNDPIDMLYAQIDALNG